MNGLPDPIRRAVDDYTPPIICRMIFDELCVLANGEIVCSCGDPSGQRVYGNVHHDRIEDIYNGPRYSELRRWQLRSQPDSYCPVIKSRCGGRRSRASNSDTEQGRTVKMLQLEPVSYCNLRCPGCPTSHFDSDPSYRKNRKGNLPLEVMLDIVNQLPDLEKILFFNFGEPFLHPDAVSFFRGVRKSRPGVLIHINTNGLALKAEDIHAITEEPLVDQLLFSIDGACQKTYRKYRRGGKFKSALHSLIETVSCAEKAGTREKLEIIWQYILFEWSDSDKEIKRAVSLAKTIGVPIKWVLTHTDGASKRFTDHSEELLQLIPEAQRYDHLTCDLQMRELWKGKGVVDDIYSARITSDTDSFSSQPASRILIPIHVENVSGSPWEGIAQNAFRLGARLRTSSTTVTSRSLTNKSEFFALRTI